MDEVEQKSTMLNRQLADLQVTGFPFRLCRHSLTLAPQNALLASEARCDKLRKELEHSQHNKQNLLQWKLSRAPLLDELEAKVAKCTPPPSSRRELHASLTDLHLTIGCPLVAGTSVGPTSTSTASCQNLKSGSLSCGLCSARHAPLPLTYEPVGGIVLTWSTGTGLVGAAQQARDRHVGAGFQRQL